MKTLGITSERYDELHELEATEKGKGKGIVESSRKRKSDNESSGATKTKRVKLLVGRTTDIEASSSRREADERAASPTVTTAVDVDMQTGPTVTTAVDVDVQTITTGVDVDVQAGPTTTRADAGVQVAVEETEVGDNAVREEMREGTFEDKCM
jgi:hypothetical protein